MYNTFPKTSWSTYLFQRLCWHVPGGLHVHMYKYKCKLHTSSKRTCYRGLTLSLNSESTDTDTDSLFWSTANYGAHKTQIKRPDAEAVPLFLKSHPRACRETWSSSAALDSAPLDYFVSRPPVCRILSPCHALALRRICLNMESEAACNAGCLENDPVLGHSGSFSQFHTETLEPVARFDTFLSLPVRPEHRTPWNTTPTASGARGPRIPMKQLFSRLSQKQARSEAWLMRSPPETLKSQLYLSKANAASNAARKVNPTAHHASARRPLTPCTLHQSSDGSNPTLSLSVSQGTGNVTKRQKIKLLNPQVVGRNTARKHNSEIPSPHHKLQWWAMYHKPYVAQSERLCQAPANSIESFLAIYPIGIQLLKFPGKGTHNEVLWSVVPWPLS